MLNMRYSYFKLRYPADWTDRPGDRGGKAAIFVKREKLEEVFLKYYAKK
jgi:hypothetical protein